MEPCSTQECPAPDCAAVPGSVFSPCGPPCPRSCDDISHCAWRCQPGCYCTGGALLDAAGTACVAPENCSCLDLRTGQRHRPGHSEPRGDGCNNCTCTRGKLLCTGVPCPVPGGWCEWSPWTPCSRTCGEESSTRHRACSCPAPQQGGPGCPGGQEGLGAAGTQLQRKECPNAPPCPEDGVWASWGPWSPCGGCGGLALRTRSCSGPPARSGGRPCAGEARQSRPCPRGAAGCQGESAGHQGARTPPQDPLQLPRTVVGPRVPRPRPPGTCPLPAGCGGDLVALSCGKPCPRSCADLREDTACLDGPRCQPACACPPGRLLQDGACVPPERCRCPRGAAAGRDLAETLPELHV
ncbi:SCO-spondin [Aix galericulata]|nr:SCO-spondin [Aix galericulata]